MRFKYSWLWWRFHGLISWSEATLFRLRHGFDYRDCWGLDHALAKWLAPRLRHMSKIAHGAPWGYGTSAEERSAANHPNDIETDFDGWKRDLGAAADRLEAIVKWDNEADPGDFADYSQYNEIERWIYDEASAAMKWVAENFHSLWD